MCVHVFFYCHFNRIHSLNGKDHTAIISSFAKHIWFHHHHHCHRHRWLRRCHCCPRLAFSLFWCALTIRISVWACMVAYYLIWVMWLWYENTITWNWLPHFCPYVTCRIIFKHLKKSSITDNTYTDTLYREWMTTRKKISIQIDKKSWLAGGAGKM